VHLAEKRALLLSFRFPGDKPYGGENREVGYNAIYMWHVAHSWVRRAAWRRRKKRLPKNAAWRLRGLRLLRVIVFAAQLHAARVATLHESARQTALSLYFNNHRARPRFPPTNHGSHHNPNPPDQQRRV
jgi:hypothetical protein